MKTLVLACFILLIVNTLSAQNAGCPDPAANNYDSTVTVNDGSCTYNSVTLKPKVLYNMNTTVNETSGLLWWQSLVFTHNDSGGEAALYAMNNTTNTIQRKIIISNATNIDWEDVAQDSKYFYIGDFGNNSSGNRTNLKIYKVAKSAILAGNTVTASVINFSYNDQTDFSPKSSNNTDFDCEAMIAYGDSLFLFSKDWIDNKTRLYKLPKKPGTYQAINIGELNVQGLITGAEIVSSKRVIVLSGYSSSLQPFVYLLYDFTGNRFFDVNKRKIIINESFTQIEGICAKSSTAFYLSNEKFSKFGITTPAKLQQISLSSYLKPYYNSLLKRTANFEKIPSLTDTNNSDFVRVLTTPKELRIERYPLFTSDIAIEIADIAGRVIYAGTMRTMQLNIDISNYHPGIYFTKLSSGSKQLKKKFFVE